MRHARTNESDGNAAAYSRVAGLVHAGEWTTYGDIAIAVHNRRGYARLVARAAAGDDRFPNAHRVLRSDGSVARPGGNERTAAAAARLRAEGVVFAGAHADPARRVFFDELQRRAGTSPRVTPPRR